jgi:hypothetical protein
MTPLSASLTDTIRYYQNNNEVFYPQSSVSVAEADRAISHAADHTRTASDIARYQSEMKKKSNLSHTPASLSRGDLVNARKPDTMRGNFCLQLERSLHDCRVPLGH